MAEDNDVEVTSVDEYEQAERNASPVGTLRRFDSAEVQREAYNDSIRPFEELEHAIKMGGSVVHNGVIITSLQELPGSAEKSTDLETRLAAAQRENELLRAENAMYASSDPRAFLPNPGLSVGDIKPPNYVAPALVTNETEDNKPVSKSPETAGHPPVTEADVKAEMEDDELEILEEENELLAGEVEEGRNAYEKGTTRVSEGGEKPRVKIKTAGKKRKNR